MAAAAQALPVLSYGGSDCYLTTNTANTWTAGEADDFFGEDYAVLNWNATDSAWNDLPCGASHEMSLRVAQLHVPRDPGSAGRAAQLRTWLALTAHRVPPGPRARAAYGTL